MTKRVKILFLSLLTAIFALCVAAIALPSFSAKADTMDISATGISDDNFSFTPGAYIQRQIFADGVDPSADNFDLTTANTLLRFDFNLEDFNYENFSDSVNHPKTFWGSLGYNVFIYEFNLIRSNGDGDGADNFATGEKQYSALIVIWADSSKTFYGYVAEKDYYNGVSLIPENQNYLFGSHIPIDTKTTYDYIATEGTTETEGETEKTYGRAYTITEKLRLSKNNLAFEQDDGLKFHLVACVNSPFTYYCIQARYHFTTVSGAGMFNTDYSHDYGEICSSKRSLAKCLQRANEMNEDFEELFGDRAVWAERIMSVDNTQRVRIRYLTPIEGTPYATHAYTYVEVPMLQDAIYIDDVEQALGFSIQKCLESNFKCFTKSTDIDGIYYKAEYFVNVWMRAITVDGHYYDYFLDINESYKETYMHFVNAGILDEGAFEWIFSTQMMNKFPALGTYHVSDVYGYFGICIIPETYTLNSAFKVMFDIETSKIGAISTFSFERTLSYNDYNTLLTDYNYGFLSRVWSNVAGWASGEERNATYYIFYSEPGTEKALIGEGGQEDQEDPGSVIENKVVKPIGGIIGNLWNGAIDFFTGISSNFKTILWIVLGVIALIVGFKVYGIIKGNKNSRRK